MHTPIRPDWTCAACPDQPWPCEPARDALVAELTPRGLAEHMATMAATAGEDLYPAPTDDLGPRFLAWTRARR